MDELAHPFRPDAMLLVARLRRALEHEAADLFPAFMAALDCAEHHPGWTQALRVQLKGAAAAMDPERVGQHGSADRIVARVPLDLEDERP